jgi:hemoglobin
MECFKRTVSVAILALLCSLVFSVALSPFAVQTLAQEMKMEKKMMKKEKTLYDRLGGKSAITAVVDAFVANVAADTVINHFFAHTDISHLKMMLVDQICQATGGPCKYKGMDMKSAHKGMGVSTADFNALVDDLVKALDKFKVPEKEKNELLGILGPMQKDIVEKK